MLKKPTIHRFSFIKNWTIRSQIHLLSTLLISLSIILTTSLLFAFLSFSKDAIITSTLLIQEKETKNQITQYNYLQTRSFTRLLNFSYNSLNILNKLNHFVEKQIDSFEIVMPTDCIDDPALWDQYIFQCNLCYKFCNKTAVIDYGKFTQFFQLISLITETLPIINIYRQTFFTSTNFEQFFTVYKGGDYTQFVAHIRPWYINHMNRTKYENHTFYLSDLYLDWIKKLAIAFTVSLTDRNGNMIGVLGYDLSFDLLPAFFDSHLKMDIVNSTGYLLVSSYYEEYKYPSVIFNTSLTGFTETDWDRIKQFGDEGVTGNGTLHVKNKKSEIIFEVSVFKLVYPELYIIIYSTDDQFLLDQHTLLNSLEQFDQFIISETFYYSLGILLAMLFIQFIIIRYVLSNLRTLLLVTKQKIFLKYKIKNKKVTLSSDQTSTISQLCAAFIKLNQNLTNFKWKKSRFCQQIERIRYPHRNVEMDKIVFEELYCQFEKYNDRFWNMEFKEPSEFLQKVYTTKLTHMRRSFKSLFMQKYGTL